MIRRGDSRQLARWLRVRAPRRFVLLIVIATALAAGMHGQDTPVPIVPGEVLVRLSPLSPVVITVPLLLTASNDLQQFERLPDSRSLTAVRFTGSLAILVAGAALAASSTVIFGHTDRAVDVAETSANFVASGLIGCSLLGADLGWVVPCSIAVATFFFGKNQNDQVLPWAWLLQSPTSPLMVTMTTAFLVGALALVSLHDTDGSRRRP